MTSFKITPDDSSIRNLINSNQRAEPAHPVNTVAATTAVSHSPVQSGGSVQGNAQPQVDRRQTDRRKQSRRQQSSSMKYDTRSDSERRVSTRRAHDQPGSNIPGHLIDEEV